MPFSHIQDFPCLEANLFMVALFCGLWKCYFYSQYCLRFKYLDEMNAKCIHLTKLAASEICSEPYATVQ